MMFFFKDSASAGACCCCVAWERRPLTCSTAGAGGKPEGVVFLKGAEIVRAAVRDTPCIKGESAWLWRLADVVVRAVTENFFG